MSLVKRFKCNRSPAQLVHSLADTLEHDQTQWDSNHGVHHGEEFTGHRAGSGMSIPGKLIGTVIARAGKFSHPMVVNTVVA